MAQVDLDRKYKKASARDIDRFRLQKDERARIILVDKQMNMLIRHWITTGPPREDGRTPGRYVACKGSYDAFMAEGVDTDTCPACAVASPDSPVGMPRRQFACNIARYHTNARGEVITPISLAHQVWVFGDDKFNRLVDRAEEHGDLRKIDLTIRCTSSQFQNFDIEIGRGAAFAQDENSQAQYKAIVDTRPQNLEDILGADLPMDRLEQLVNDAMAIDEPEQVLDDVDTIASPDVLDSLNKQLDAELGDGQNDATLPDEPKQPAPAVDFASLLGD